jgi:RNA polymerase sigma-70 factor, ECF subfamily
MAGLIAAIANREEKVAFAAVFNHFAPRLKGLMMQEGFSGEHAEEIALRTMTAVWREAGLFSSQDVSVATWVFVLARSFGLTVAQQRPTRPDT